MAQLGLPRAKRSAQRASPQLPCALPGPSSLSSPIAIQLPDGARGCSPVSLCMNGSPSRASNTVHQTEPLGSCLGRLCTV
jgi:hypothetical protein